MRFLYLSTLLILSRPTFACINVVGTDYHGSRINAWDLASVSALRLAMDSDPKIRGAALEQKTRGTTEFKKRSDYAASLIYLGRYQAAIDLLEQLEKETPGRYFVAGNLGTAYELIGENEKALLWIKKEIARNRSAHNGTEWLHVTILETKLKLKQQPDWLKTHTILDLQPGKIPRQINLQGIPTQPFKIAPAFQDQLMERMLFVKAPDAIVAAALYDYGALETQVGTLENAEKLFELAEQYSFPSEKIDPLLAEFHQKIAARKSKEFTVHVVIGIGVGLLLGVVFLGIFILSKARRSKPASTN